MFPAVEEKRNFEIGNNMFFGGENFTQIFVGYSAKMQWSFHSWDAVYAWQLLQIECSHQTFDIRMQFFLQARNIEQCWAEIFSTKLFRVERRHTRLLISGAELFMSA
jgi:hypothetical protein